MVVVDADVDVTAAPVDGVVVIAIVEVVPVTDDGDATAVVGVDEAAGDAVGRGFSGAKAPSGVRDGRGRSGCSGCLVGACWPC